MLLSQDYWANNKIFSTTWFSSIMAYDWSFHIVDMDSSLQKRKGEDGYDLLFKSDRFNDYLFSSVLLNVSVDETMISTWCKITLLESLPKTLQN